MLRKAGPESPQASPAGSVSRDHLDLPNDFSAPHSELEARIADLWRQAFNLDMVGRDDDFFDLQGDSLIATTIAAAISNEFRTDFQPSMLMTLTTVADVARHLRDRAAGEEAPEDRAPDIPAHIAPIRTQGDLPPLFVIHGKRGFSMPHRGFLDGLDARRPLYFLQAIGYMGEPSPPDTVERIAAAYLRSMRRVQPSGPLHIAAFCAGGFIAIEIARLRSSAGEPAGAVVLIDPPIPFRLRRNPLVAEAHLGWLKFRTVVTETFIDIIARLRGAVMRGERRHSVDELVTELESCARGTVYAGAFSPAAARLAFNTLQNAFWSYRPMAYDGRLDVITCDLRKPAFQGGGAPWGRLLSNAEIQVGGDGHTELIRKDPAGLARRVEACLQRSGA